MILNNKKILSLLILTTAVFSGYYILKNKLTQKQDQDVMNEKLVQEYSIEINKKLPLVINPYYTLIKTKVGHLSPTIPTLDLYYSLNVKDSEIKDFDIISSHVIEDSCKNTLTQSLINQNAILRHQFVTTDKVLKPLIGVAKVDCFLLENKNQNKEQNEDKQK